MDQKNCLRNFAGFVISELTKYNSRPQITAQIETDKPLTGLCEFMHSCF